MGIDRDLRIDTFAMPCGGPTGAPAVRLTLYHEAMTQEFQLTLDQAEDACSRLGTAIGAIKLGVALARGDDPRDAERVRLAKLAIRLGLTDSDVRTVFDLSAREYARLAAEVAR